MNKIDYTKPCYCPRCHEISSEEQEHIEAAQLDRLAKEREAERLAYWYSGDGEDVAF